MQDRYTKVAITLHWVIALLIIIQLGTGITFGFHLAPKSILFPMIQFHKSIGLTILVLSLMRLAWRLTHKAPPLPAHMPLWEKLAAKASHYAFYFLIIFVPFSGWLLVSSSAMGFPTSYFNLFIWPHLPGIENLPDAQKEHVNGLAYTAHVYLAYSTLGLLCLHIAAALKHHFINRDEVLHHMIPIVKPKLPKAALSIFAALLFLSSAGYAAPWTIDKSASSIQFSGDNSGQKFEGSFDDWAAQIDFDPAKLESSSVIVTIKTASAKTGTATYDETLPKKEWFDAAGFPDAVFNSKDIKLLSADKYEAKGTLTIKNISREITLPFTLTITGKNADMSAALSVNRLDFDIGKKADPDAEWVSKDIPLVIHVKAAVL